MRVLNQLIILFGVLTYSLAFHVNVKPLITRNTISTSNTITSNSNSYQNICNKDCKTYININSNSNGYTNGNTRRQLTRVNAAINFPAAEIIRSTPSMINSTVSKSSLSFRALFLMATGFLITFRNKIKANFKFAAEQMEAGWSKRGNSGGFRRTVEIWFFAINFIYKFVKNESKKKKAPEVYEKGQEELAIILRDKLLELGPTFIKLGQLLSTRIDIVPRAYISALKVLQDNVPGFPGEKAIEILEKELGKPINELFEEFSLKPLAAASLGQVHVAKLNGKQVAVKIQRQGLKELFDMDLKNIKVLAKLLDAFDPKSDGAQRDWGSIYDESAKLLYKEIDYKNEAYNAMRFKNNFKNVPWVKVPEVYLNMTTTNVITMEYVPGIKISEIEKIEEAGIDRSLLAKRSAESYLMQLCRYGFFHCDPHPGNVACDAAEGGRLIYYDFGMMDELKDETKQGLVELIFGIYENEVKEVCDALEKIEVLKKGVDRLSIEKITRFFLSEFATGVKSGEKWVSQLPEEEQKEIRRKRRLQLAGDLFSVGSDVPFKFPPTFTFVFRAFTSLDGIGKGLDKNYDLVRLTQPFLRELIDLKDGSAIVSFAKSWGKKLGWRPIDIQNAITSPRKIANIDDIITRMEQGELKVRVRVLESERAFQRMSLVQGNMANAIAASAFLNVGLLLSTVSTPTASVLLFSRLSLAMAAVFGVQLPIGISKVAKLDKKFKNGI